MANNFSTGYVASYLNMLDQINAKASVTKILETSILSIKFAADNAKVVYLQNLTLEGMGTYDRHSGYPVGDADLAQTAYTMATDRGKKFILDALDSKQAQLEILALASEFNRTKVVPEMDAYRFAKLVSLCGMDVEANLTYDTVLNAIDTGIAALDNAEAGMRRVLYVSNGTYALMKQSGEFFNARIATEMSTELNREITVFDGMPLIRVPATRFYQTCTLSATDGYTNAGKALNFAIVDVDAVAAPVKYLNPKIIAPEMNADNDAYVFGMRVYHDLFVPTNKLNNIYIHAGA